ncbi:acyl-CoA thioester hydrolase [Sphingobacterium lactis]|uniref:Acyl-CoA thioester hydrolase n=2 Tax=Sphingobacterium lactis TaxID=797291 RepID=A0A1H5WMR2_9SPHI|nr:acyl-CoA thioester hydrolase [Sphingobacterium lactis]
MGLSLEEFNRRKIGPILFREELSYFREIGLDERITVTVQITKFNTVNSRFSFRHEIFKENGVRAALVTVDGAWMNIVERKLTPIPEEWKDYVAKIPKAEDYIEVSE